MMRTTCAVAVAVAAVVIGLATTECSAQTADINFATLPNGVQVPAATVGFWSVAGIVNPASKLPDPFAALGIHFDTAILFFDPLGRTTAPDGWCMPESGFACGTGNLVYYSPLKITFDVPQTSVQMDIASALGACTGPSATAPVTLNQVTVNGGTGGPISLSLTQDKALTTCAVSSSDFCGRFQVSAGTGATFKEIDFAGITNCTGLDQLGLGQAVDNVSFTAPSSSQPVAVAVVKNTQGSPTSSFCSGETAVFDASGSTPKDGSLTYSWADVIDNPPLFSSPLTGATPSLSIPNLPFPRSFSVQLTATDPFGLSGTTSVPVFVKPNNLPPVAVVQPVPPTAVGSLVKLDGSQSFDPNGDTLSYAWTQVAGPFVTLDNPVSATPSFTAPIVPIGTSTTLTFRLTVTDIPSSTQCGGPLASVPISVDVIVENRDHPPNANAGAAQTVTSGAKVTLDASASNDPDGDAITYQWTQVAGTPVTLSNPSVASPQFIAPPEPPNQQEILTFQLVVTDQLGVPSAPATVDITVQAPHAAPGCDKAVASLNRVWPPDRRLVGPLAIINTTDNAPGSVTITIRQIYQDEPPMGPGVGETETPQAKIMNDGTFFLRAARLATGDGRVYHVSFIAANGYGSSCSGVVTVCVPRDGNKATTCGDQGPLYNSTQ